MHLLAQSKINGEFDDRIPHLRQIQNLIDDIVLKDITIWEQQIIDSGYLSEAIVRIVNEKLRNKEATFQEFKTSVEIIAALANRNEWGSKTKVYESLINLLKIKNLKLQKVVLQKLVKILDETVNEEVSKKSLSRILPLLNTWALNEYVNITLAKIINITPDLTEQILNQIQILKEPKLLFNSLDKAIKAMPVQKAFIFLKEIIINPNAEYRIRYEATEMVIDILKISRNLAYELFIFFKEEFINSEYIVDCVIIKNLVIIAKIMPSLSYEVFILLGDIIRNPKVDHIIRADAVESMVKIIPNLTAEAFTFLKEIMINTSTEYKVNYAAIQGLAGIIKLQPSLAEEAFIFLKKMITNPNYNLGHVAVSEIVEIVKIKPSLVEEAFIFLKEVIISSNYDVNFEAGDNIIKIVKIKPTYEAFILLKELVMSSNIDDYNKYAVVTNLGEIVKALPSLIPEAVTFLEEIVTNPNVYCETRFGAAESIAELVKVNLIKELKPIWEALSVLKWIITDSNNDFKSDTFEKIINIVRAIPSLAPDAFSFLKEIVADSEQELRSEAMENILQIIEITPNLTKKTFDFWKEIVTNPKYNVDYTIVDKLPEIVKIMPSLTMEAFFISENMLTINDDYFFKAIVIDNMVNIAKINPNIIEEVFKILKEILSNLESNPEINYSATEGLIVLLNIVLLGKKYIYISELLNVIYLEKTENLDEELQLRATLTLHKITNHITQEYEKRKNPKMIKWFNGCFKELPNIAETRIFLKEICKTILKSGVINRVYHIF